MPENQLIPNNQSNQNPNQFSNPNQNPQSSAPRQSMPQQPQQNPPTAIPSSQKAEPSPTAPQPITSSQQPQQYNNQQSPPQNLPQTKLLKPIRKFSLPSKITKIISFVVFFLVLIILLLVFFRLPFKINVSPSAEILIDKKNKGECSNCSFWLKPGKHTIRFEKVGYKPETRIIEQSWFKAGNLAVYLKEAPKLQSIDSGNNAFIQKKNNLIQVLYFNPTKKAFYSYNPRTKEKVQITPSYFYNLQKIKWSTTGEGAVVWLKYNTSVFKNTPFYKSNLKNGDLAVYFYDFHRYEITKQQASFWGTDINVLAWAPVLGRFYYLGGSQNQGFLGKAEQNGKTKNKLLTNLPFSEGDLAVDSAEITAYLLGGYENKKIYSTEIIDPTRELKPLLEESNKTSFVFLNDDWLLIGVSQGNPEYKSQEKFSLYNLLDKEFKGKEFYANQNWFYQLDENSFVVLEATKNSWIIKKIILPELKEDFSYEFLATEKPDGIWYEETNKNLFLSINNKLYFLPLLFE